MRWLAQAHKDNEQLQEERATALDRLASVVREIERAVDVRTAKSTNGPHCDSRNTAKR